MKYTIRKLIGIILNLYQLMKIYEDFKTLPLRHYIS